MALWIAAFVVLVIAVDAGWIASMVLQRSAAVRDQDGRRYWVRLTPTGMRWVTWHNLDLSAFSASAHWVIRFYRHEQEWTVAVGGRWPADPPLMIEQLPDRRSAISRLNELAEQLESGVLNFR